MSLSKPELAAVFKFRCGCVVRQFERPGRSPLYVLDGCDEGYTPAPWAITAYKSPLMCARITLQQYCPHDDVLYDWKRELVEDRK